MVLYWSDGTSSDPVDLSSILGGIEFLVRLLLATSNIHTVISFGFVTKKGLVLLRGPVRELVVAEGEAAILRVVGLNRVITFREEGKTSFELNQIANISGELSEVVHVVEFEVGDGGDGTDREGKSEGFHMCVCGF